jgi:hypothetical protein
MPRRLFLSCVLVAACAPAAKPLVPAPSENETPVAAPDDRADKGPPPPSIARGLAKLWADHSDDRVSTPEAETTSDTAPPQAAPLDTARVAAVLSSLSLERKRSVLLLGVHVENVADYRPLYSGEGYPVDERPGYRTIVVELTPDQVRIAADLPYLMLPAAKGFDYVGEAEISIDEGFGETNEYGFAMPHTYAASTLVSASSPQALSRRIDGVKKKLRGQRQWGRSEMETLLAITPRAQCSQRMNGQVTGGALGFYASTYMHMSRVGGLPLHRKRLTESELQAFGERLEESRGERFARRPDGRIDLDKPVDMWWRTMDWRADVEMCIARQRGRMQITGSTTVPGNSARSFTMAFVLGDAPSEFAPGNRMPIAFDRLEAVVDGLMDAAITPHDDAIVLLAGGRLVVLDATAKELMSADIGLVRPVMVEWATGAAAERWVAAAKGK